MVDFALRLRQLRKDKHLTQAQVASRIGVTPSMVSSYETDIRLPSYDVMMRIADVFGVTVDYLLEEIAIAEGSLSKKAEFLTKYCCIKQSSSQAWLATKNVDGAVCEPLLPKNFYNCYAVGGIDLSQTTDLTSACVVIEKDGIEYVISHFWLPAEKLDEAIARDDIPYREMIERGFMSVSGEGFVDYNDVFRWFMELVQEYKVMPLAVGYDRYSSQYLVQQMKNDAGFLMDDVYQGWNMTPAINKLEGELKEKVESSKAPFLYCDADLLEYETENREIKYYLFERK